MGLGKKSKSKKAIAPPPPPPPPDDSTATTATTIADSVADSSVAESSVAESSVADSSVVAAPKVPPPPDKNNNTAPTSIAESVAPDLNKRPPPPRTPRAPDETCREQRKLGYLSSTGVYGDVLFYNTTRSNYLLINNFEKVKVVDAAWQEKYRQDKLAVRSWPPKRLFLKTYFWTSGHYKYCTDKYLRSKGGVPVPSAVTFIPTTAAPSEMVTEKRLSKSTEEKRLSKSAETKRLSKTEETKINEVTTDTKDTLLITKATKNKSSRRINAKDEEPQPEEGQNTLLVTKATKKKSSRKINAKDEEPQPEEGQNTLLVTKANKKKSSRKINAIDEETTKDTLVITKATKKKSSRRINAKEEETAPERGRRSVEEAAPLDAPQATPTPSEALPETPLNLNNFSTHRLHVANIPLDVNIKDVQKLFKGGTVDLYPDPAGTQMLATVRYENVKDAHKAFQNAKKAKLNKRPLVVSPKLREG